MAIDFYIDDEDEDTIVDSDCQNECIPGHEDHDPDLCNIKVG